MKRYYILLLTILYNILISNIINAQNKRNPIYESYIDDYCEIAVEHMHKYRIPASITLSQGLLESGAGQSELARKSNNHFGIKCAGGWNGKTVTYSDDRPDDCFRVYKSVKDSYEDHALFLKKDRYQRLYDLDIMDYKGWARGLKSCGYATNPSYANLLINLIELYNLDRFDKLAKSEKGKIRFTVYFSNHRLIQNNGLDCIVIRAGDTWESISRDVNIPVKKLFKYNESNYNTPLVAGEFVYLEKKKRKASKIYKDYWHKIQDGESMYNIAQSYGIRLERLYKLNYKKNNYMPSVGDLLRVR